MSDEVDPEKVSVEMIVNPENVQDRFIDPLAPHARPDDLDPKVNGPFLDDIRREQAHAVFETRNVLAEKDK